MQTLIVIQQMIIIFLLILTGATLNRTKLLSEDTSKQISGIILKVTNPALMITSALTNEERLSSDKLIEALIFFAIMYIVFMVLSFILPVMIGIKKEDRYSFKMMTVFGNVGFIGIPLASAVLGSESLIYVSICNLLYSLVFYTFGTSVMRKAAIEQGCEVKDDDVKKFKLPGWINIGTVTAVITIILYVMDLKLPAILDNTLSAAGRSTTFLSMLVLGVSVSTMNPKKVFGNVRLYIFGIIKLVLVPIFIIVVFRLFTDNQLLINTLIIMVSISYANMPLMLAKTCGVREDDISGGIILSVVMSLVTIPLVSFILSLI